MPHRTLTFRGGWWEREGEVYNLHLKNKLKSKIFNNKKFFKQKRLCHNYEFKLGNFNLEFITFKL